MKKLIDGIIEFQEKVLPDYKETFAKLALGQKPDTLFIACSGSRVVPNLFASTNPGDLFVIRNVGNIIPPCDHHGHSIADESEAAAIEFAITSLGVKDIIVCGHSECGAMHAICNDRHKISTPNLRGWLRHAEVSLEILEKEKNFAPELTNENRISQVNVILQMEHLKTYPLIKERLQSGQLRIHGWWFELKTAQVYIYQSHLQKFALINKELAEQLIRKLDKK